MLQQYLNIMSSTNYKQNKKKNEKFNSVSYEFRVSLKKYLGDTTIKSLIKDAKLIKLFYCSNYIISSN